VRHFRLVTPAQTAALASVFVVGSRIFRQDENRLPNNIPFVALGALFLLLPGIAVAVGFAFAVPVTMSEGISGRAALERSWSLMRGHWVPAIGVFALIAGLTLLASAASMLGPPGPWRAAISTGIRLLTYPLPLIALVLLYQRARRQEGAEL